LRARPRADGSHHHPDQPQPAAAPVDRRARRLSVPRLPVRAPDRHRARSGRHRRNGVRSLLSGDHALPDPGSGARQGLGGGEPALGVFTALAYLFVAALQPMLALGAAVNPRLARHFVHDLAAFRRLTSRTMVVAGALGLLGIVACALFGRRMLTLFYAPEY